MYYDNDIKTSEEHISWDIKLSIEAFPSIVDHSSQPLRDLKSCSNCPDIYGCEECVGNEAAIKWVEQ